MTGDDSKSKAAHLGGFFHGRWLPLCLLLMAPAAQTANHGPVRPPEKGCAWHLFSDGPLGLDAWVQNCDFGSRQIDFGRSGNSLAVRYSDAPKPEPLVDVIVLEPGVEPAEGLTRYFKAHTSAAVAQRCRLERLENDKAPNGALRYTFVPDADYARELKAKQNPDEVPEPPCGELGDAPDGVQYFEVHPLDHTGKALFVRVGQDTPLFDENSLRLRAPTK